MRALGLTFLGFLLFGGVVFTAVYVATVNKVKETEPYRLALEAASSHHAVRSHLGQPIEPSWRAAGFIDEAKDEAEVVLRLVGPTGKATVRARAERAFTEAGVEWELVFLDVATYSDFGVQVVEIIDDKPPVGVQLPEPTPEAKERYGVSESDETGSR